MCVYGRNSVREGNRGNRVTKKKGERRREGEKGEKGGNVLQWVYELHNQPSEVMETGRPLI